MSDGNELRSPARKGVGVSSEPKATEERFQAVMELIPDAVVITDGDGCITFVNRQTEELFGYARADLLGQPRGVPDS